MMAQRQRISVREKMEATSGIAPAGGELTPVGRLAQF
jgi:hypothetical protein